MIKKSVVCNFSAINVKPDVKLFVACLLESDIIPGELWLLEHPVCLIQP